MPGVAWAHNGKYMTATDPELLKRLRRKEMSASRSFALDPGTCSVGMVADMVLPREDDLFEANQLGTAAHGVLEAMFQMEGPKRTKEAATAIMHQLREDREFALTFLDENLTDQIHDLGPADLIRWYDEVQTRVHGLWKIEDPTKVTVHFTEMEFGAKFDREVKIGKVPFTGFIDRVDQILDLATGEIVGYKVVDFKAGKFKDGSSQYGDDYGDQIRLYVVAVREAEGITPDSGALYFIKYGKDRDIDTSPDKVAATVRRFERAWDRMNELADKNQYPTKVGPLCGWCKLVNACPAGLAAGKTDLSNTDKVNGKRVVIPGKAKKGLDRVLLGIPTLPAPGAAPVPAAPTDVPAGLLESAAHRENEPITERINPTMADAATLVSAETSEAAIKGDLNANSPAAQAVFHLSSLAVQELTRNEVTVNGATVRALTQTYATVIQAVEFALTGASDWQSPLNARLRAAFNTTVDTYPAPWLGSAEDWDAWVKSATNRTKAIASSAVKLWERGAELPDRPWSGLVGMALSQQEDETENAA